MPSYLYILYNAFFWNICFFLCWNQVKKQGYNPSISGDRFKQSYKIIFYFFLLYSLFTFFGGDKTSYKEFVEGGYMDYFYYDFYGFEYLYVLIAKYSLGSIVLWKFVVYGLSIYLNYLSYKKIKSDNYFVLLSFVCCSLLSYGSTRGVLAYSILLYGIVTFCTEGVKNKIIGITLIICSYFAHTSMALPILLIPLCLFELNKKRLMALAIMFPVIVLGLSYLPGYFETADLGQGALIGYKFQTYADSNREYVSSYGSTLTFIYEMLNMALYIPLLYFAIKCYLKNSLPSHFKYIIALSFYLSYIGLAFKFSTLPGADIFYSRYFTMNPFFLYVVMPTFMTTPIGNFKKLKPLVYLSLIRANFFFLMQMFYESLK